MTPHLDATDMSCAMKLAAMGEGERDEVLSGMSQRQLYDLTYNWRFWARPKQLPPPGDWATWVIRAGRGFGKTRSGVGWVHERAMEQQRWIALIAKTPADARDFMVEGPGGFLDRAGRNIAPAERPLFESSKRRLTWPNGSWATIYSDEEPEQLRGFSGDTAWPDEFGKYRNPEECWDMLQFGMRECSTDRPRCLITTTPRPIEIIRTIEALPSTVTVVGSSYENRANLDPRWFAETILAYEGTALGRQEIHAELLNPEETGIVKRPWFKLWPHDKPLPEFELVIVSMDTAFTELTTDKKTHEPDPTAAGVYGLFNIPTDKENPSNKGKAAVMVLDCWDDHLNFPSLVDRARREMKVAYGKADAALIRPMFGSPLVKGTGRKPDLLLIEDKGSGISLRQQMELEGVPAHAYNPGRLDKLARLHLVSAVVKAGSVWLVESETRRGKPKTWTESMLTQLCSFAGEGSIKHDDHVDQFTQALRFMLDKHLISMYVDPDSIVDSHAEQDDEPSAFGRPLIRNNAYAT